MKIVCQSCGAKYSIADEKVAGKVFKIRCKKCSATIVVKGDQPDADQPTRVYDYGGGDAVWHAVVAGEQQGPFNPRQIGELLAEGKIDWEAYVWREGMENWLPAKDVEELVNAVMSESGDAGDAQPEPSTQTPVFGGTSDMGADPFAGGDDGGLSSVLSQPAASAVAVSEGADLFGQSAARSPFAGVAAAEAPLAGEASSPRVDAASGMTGQRNENSVLFSLSNLQALATGSGSGGTATSARPGMAAGEGSGLIDIRALASATQAVADKSNGASRDKVEDLLAVGAGSTAFSAASFAAPVAMEKPDNSKMVLGAMGAAILVLGSAVAYLALREPAPQPVAVADAPAAQQGQLAAAAPGSAPGSSSAQATAMPTPDAPPAAPSPADKEPVAPSTPDEERGAKASADKPESSSSRGDKKRGGSAGAASAPASKPEKSEPASAPEPAAPAKPSKASADSSIDDLLSGALGGKAKPPAAAAKPAAEALPATPSRDDVLNAMKSVAAQVQSCANGTTGVAQAKVMVAGPTGRVTSVDVSGAGAGGPTAACISKTVGKAKFPKFSQPTFSFTFPFKL